jgi:capsular exopolysaccharide synthesis family protein
VDTNRDLYNVLMAKMKEQAATEKIQTVNVWTIEPAKIPSDPISTHKARKLLLGLVLGLFGGIGLAFFIEYLDNTVKSPEEAESRLQVPVLGVISYLTQKDQKIEFVVANDPLSAISENYKAVRTAILLSSADKPPACLLIGSMAPKEGKTTTTSNLASALAQLGKKVVVIDADLRRPRIHKVYDLDNSVGLSNYLAGSIEPSIVKSNVIEGVHMIPSGPIPPDPSELLGSKRLEVLLAYLRQKFDVILIDSPPLLSVSDGLVLSRLVDGVLIVTRAGQTTYDIVQTGVKQLRDVHAHITGLIINGADFKKNGYDYYHGYGYYYTYHSEE